MWLIAHNLEISDKDLFELEQADGGLIIVDAREYIEFRDWEDHGYPHVNQVQPSDLFEPDNTYFGKIFESRSPDRSALVNEAYWTIYNISNKFEFTAFSGYESTAGFTFSSGYRTLVIFKFDTKSDAMLAKLALTDFWSISSEDYRRLLGETRQSSVRISVE